MDSKKTIVLAKPKKEKWELNTTIFEWFALIIAIIGIILFLWKRTFSAYLQADTSILGQFGSYIGGLASTCIAYINLKLLIKTLKSQIEANKNIDNNNKENTNIYILQQFNDIFSTLIELYHQSLNSFKSEDNTGRIFLHTQVCKMQNDYDCLTYDNDSRKNAIEYFERFYTQYRQSASVYFRLIYRIYQLVDSSKIEEYKKADYAKIIRCQFSEDELFLLRYNAMTTAGKKMQQFINRYNLLKHLPIMSLLEFKSWGYKLNNVEKNALDELFILLRKQMMCSILSISEKEKKYVYETISGKYAIQYDIDKTNSSLKIEIIRNCYIESQELSNTLVSALDIFTDDELSTLLSAFVKEVFIYSNFSSYVKETNLIMRKGITNLESNHKNVIWATIKNKDDYALIITQRQLDMPQ